MRPLVLGLLLAGATLAQDDLGTRIDGICAQWDRDDCPGLSIAVLHDGEVIFAEGYGLASLEQERPITPETIFHVASVSKQFTAFALCLLQADGKLSLDDEVRAHLTEVPDFGQPLTLKHLLHHTSGLRDQWESLAIAGWRLDDVITTEHVLTFVRHQRELNFAPGSAHLYCNTGYTLAGEVVKRVSGQPFPEFCHERIFEPLGMSRTHFHDDHEHVVVGRADSYRRTPAGFDRAVLSYANAGATSLFTTPRDLLRWLENFDQHRVGGAEVQEWMRERYTLSNGRLGSYALGVMYGNHRGRFHLSHSGGDAGFRSYVVWLPEEKLGVAVLSNLADVNPPGIANQIIDLVLPPEESPQEAGVEDDGPAAELPVQLPAPTEGGVARDLAPYAGRYWSEELGTFYDIEVADERLRVHHRRHGSFDLRAFRDDEFRSEVWFFRRLRFERAENDSVTGLRLDGGRVRNLWFERRPLPEAEDGR